MADQVAGSRATKGKHIAFLDGIRGLAVLIVFLSHAGNKGMTLPGEFSPAGIGKGGVYLFFVLSAFLITSILLRGRDRLWKADYLGLFFARRFLRVYPLFALYVACALITTPMAIAIFGSTEFAVPFPLDWYGALQHLVLARGDSVSWSIPVEMKYYLVSPLVAALMLLLSRRLGLWPAMALAVLATVASATLTASWSYIESPAGKTTQLLAYLPSFLVGAALAFLHCDEHPVGTATRLGWLQRSAGWLGLGATVVMIPSVYSAVTRQPVDQTYFHESVLLYALLWALVINACVAGDKLLTRFFTLAPLRFLGLVSFSFYLSHPVFLELSVRGIGPYSPSAAILVALLSTLGFSWLTFRLIEKPILDSGTARVAAWLAARRKYESA